jgi:hypothetical protein
MAKLHEWVPSRLGHGESMCKNCLITNREAAVLGTLNTCTALEQKPTHARDGIEAQRGLNDTWPGDKL